MYRWQDEDFVCDCVEQLQLLKWYFHSGIGAGYHRLSFDDYVEGDFEALGWVKKYIESHEQMVHKGLGFLFHGDYGTGKTLLIMLLMKELVKLGYGCFCTTFTGMIELFTAGWSSPQDKQFYHDRMKTSQILFIDDIGKEFKTKNNLAEATFDDIIRSRIQAGRPTHVTTNMQPREMIKGYGAAVFSLLQETTIAHHFSGADYRSNVVYSKLKELELGETRPIC